VGIAFGHPDSPVNEHHVQGHVAELLWSRVMRERSVCRDGRQLVKAHPVKADPLEPGGDGLVIYQDPNGVLVFRLWEIKKHEQQNVRAILTNPRYTGYQVWNRQRKQDILLDVDDVALGHETRMRWNNADAWIRSANPSHPAIIATDTFDRTQGLLAAAGRGTKPRMPRATPRVYQLSGLLFCGLCTRRMQGNFNHNQIHYRCRHTNQHDLANALPRSHITYVREAEILPAVDHWLTTLFTAANIENTIDQLAHSQPDTAADATDETQLLADYDRKIASYRAALDAGTDPTIVAQWITETQTEKAQADLQLGHHTDAATNRLTRQQIQQIVATLTDITQVIHDADPQDKAKLYRQIGLHLTYHQPTQTADLIQRPTPLPTPTNPATRYDDLPRTER
jgi:hypothetical protein